MFRSFQNTNSLFISAPNSTFTSTPNVDLNNLLAQFNQITQNMNPSNLANPTFTGLNDPLSEVNVFSGLLLTLLTDKDQLEAFNNHIKNNPSLLLNNSPSYIRIISEMLLLKGIQKQAFELLPNLNKLTAEKNVLLQQKQALMNSLQELMDKVPKINEKFKADNEDISILTQKLQQEVERVKKLESDLQTANSESKRKEEALNKKLEKMKKKISNLKEENTSLEEKFNKSEKQKRKLEITVGVLRSLPTSSNSTNSEKVSKKQKVKKTPSIENKADDSAKDNTHSSNNSIAVSNAQGLDILNNAALLQAQNETENKAASINDETKISNPADGIGMLVNEAVKITETSKQEKKSAVTHPDAMDETTDETIILPEPPQKTFLISNSTHVSNQELGLQEDSHIDLNVNHTQQRSVSSIVRNDKIMDIYSTPNHKPATAPDSQEHALLVTPTSETFPSLPNNPFLLSRNSSMANFSSSMFHRISSQGSLENQNISPIQAKRKSPSNQN